MDRKKPEDPEQTLANLAPETHDSEQDGEDEQAQSVAEESGYKDAEASPLDSVKPANAGSYGQVMDDATQDLIDRMRDMEQSGRIDMGAYRGEPNMDDDEDKYGPENKEDNLPGDGTDEGSLAGPRE